MALVLASTALLFVSAAIFSAFLLGREEDRKHRQRVRVTVNPHRRRSHELTR